MTVFIEESALTAHAYPELDFITLNLETCKAIPDVKHTVAMAIEHFGLRLRGWAYLPWWNAGEMAGEAFEPERWPLWLKEAANVTC